MPSQLAVAQMVFDLFGACAVNQDRMANQTPDPIVECGPGAVPRTSA